MITKNAVIDVATEGVKRWGFCDFTSDGTFDPIRENQVRLQEDAVPVITPIYYNKIVDGVFVEMDETEKAATDLVFGPIAKSVSVEAEQLNATTSPQIAMSRSIPANRLPIGSYQLSFYCELAVESLIASSAAKVDVKYQGVSRASSVNDLTQYISHSGSYIIDVIKDTPIDISIEFWRIGAPNTAKIRRCRLAIVKEG